MRDRSPASRIRIRGARPSTSGSSALLAGSPRIAYYYAQPDTSTFRYRAFNMIEALGRAEPDASVRPGLRPPTSIGAFERSYPTSTSSSSAARYTPRTSPP